MNRFRSSYNRVIYLTCFALILIASAMQGAQYVREREIKIGRLQTQVDSYASNFNIRARSVMGYTEGLRRTAEQYLFYVKHYNMSSPFWQYLKPVSGTNLFSLSPPHADKERTGNLVGIGNLDTLGQEETHEIQMALLLNPAFQVALEKTRGAVWVYYTSRKQFQHLYPWLPPSNAEYYKNVLNADWMRKASPEQNPMRKNFWSSPYKDGMTKGSRYRRGKVLSNVSPVYDQDRFIGTISIDVAVSELERVLKNFHSPSGLLILMSNNGEIIAEGNPEDTNVSVDTIFSSEFGNKLRDLIQSPPKQTIQLEGHLVYCSPIVRAPWTLVYIGQPQVMFEMDLIHGIEDILIIALCLIFVVGIGYFVVTRDFISPAQKLLTHIEKENKGEPSHPTDLPVQWAEWFDIVSKIFEENRSLMNNLESRVKRRTQQLHTKNKKLEKTLEDLKKAQDQIILQEKLASLGALTAGIAHEIKNPLHFIINFTEVSQESLHEIKAKLTSEEKKQIQQIEENLERVLEHANRADSIVKGMLSHARGSNGKFEPADLNKLLIDSVDLAYAGFCGKGTTFPLEIKADLDENLPHIKVSSPDLSRVFLNIANNACFAMNEKLKKQKKSYDPTLKIRTHKDKKSILITIEDNGTGIPKSVLKKIFHPFFTTKDPGKGTGLGMSLSYEILTQQHQGEMWIESELNKFSRFHIKLPC